MNQEVTIYIQFTIEKSNMNGFAPFPSLDRNVFLTNVYAFQDIIHMFVYLIIHTYTHLLNTYYVSYLLCVNPGFIAEILPLLPSWNQLERQLLSKGFQVNITVCANVLKQKECNGRKERRAVMQNWTGKIKPRLCRPR